MGDNIITANIGIYIIQIIFLPVIIQLFHWGNAPVLVIISSGFVFDETIFARIIYSLSSLLVSLFTGTGHKGKPRMTGICHENDSTTRCTAPGEHPVKRLNLSIL
jgi:hypothetical protein